MPGFHIARLPQCDFGSIRQDHLWVIVGGGDYFEGGAAIYLGPDSEVDADDLSGRRFRYVIGRLRALGIEAGPEALRDALRSYRGLPDEGQAPRLAA